MPRNAHPPQLRTQLHRVAALTQPIVLPQPSPAPIVDIGLNLAHDSFDHDRTAVIERAVAVGVTRMVITGSSLDSTRAAIEIVRQAPDRFRCTAGVHPHHATELTDEQYAQLRPLAECDEVAAVGECGLDYFRNFSPREAQLAAFRRQLELAIAVGKPVFNAMHTQTS
jgi:TatD DNase family protein